MQQKHYVPTFHFDTTKPCYCRSQKAFGECCGSSIEEKQTPKSIKVVHNFLSASECNSFIRFAEKQKREWLTVVDTAKSTSNKRVYKRHESRVTQNVDLGKKRALANDWFKRACSEYLVEISGGLNAQWFEEAQLLRYGPGGKYGIHADSDQFCQQAKQFYRFIDRDFSMLIYLNDDYVGGGLYFKGLNYTYQPKRGDLVIFPSNHVFSHESLPIEQGKKLALVSWGAFPGTARVSQPRSIVPMATNQ
ncbi:hypothetical protein A3715_07475 [Oleiphilus sp. HI0009]|uniref:prolyl hydroxylase family protein n=1 Tax=Oleiphilus sp. HI0125 TaxID=1822266 RepID=UPI0007C21F5F|nr:2OG-Fe(II) oxygenase [Oleiphilus sp. HI0125]KZX81364.1 hypothetical protein A3715_07475 [Oleiphilus sp. HI0009]KZZ59504.1 hypothetical protein A3762_00555 [Oleiphilus sp. HI0125]MCH2159660.1 2OG-Fe(II) oxygenase [Oleiphilaceae bacterium]